MVTVEQTRDLLVLHGDLRPQPSSDWNGVFPIPLDIAEFYQDIGPVDVTIRGYGNPYFLPCLRNLWKFQVGYRWNGLDGRPIEDWNDDWLVVADEGGDPFIFSRSSGAVLHAYHGEGNWDAREMFPDLNTMAACLAQMGAIRVQAGEQFTDENHNIRPQYRDKAFSTLRTIFDSDSAAEIVLGDLGWG